MKFLGVIIDNHLTWNQHINEVANKISRTSGILRKLKNYLPSNILLLIYRSLVESHLNYGITLWGFGNLTRLKKLQKQSIRAVAKAKYNAHTENIFKKLQTLKVEDLFKLSCLKIYFKFSNDQLPLYFRKFKFNMINQIDTNHPVRVIRAPGHLRNDHVIDMPNICHLVPVTRTNYKNTRKCLRFEIPELINSGTFPLSLWRITTTHSLLFFKKLVKQYMLEKYEDRCNRTNCYICSQN